MLGDVCLWIGRILGELSENNLMNRDLTLQVCLSSGLLLVLGQSLDSSCRKRLWGTICEWKYADILERRNDSDISLKVGMWYAGIMASFWHHEIPDSDLLGLGTTCHTVLRQECLNLVSSCIIYWKYHYILNVFPETGGKKKHNGSWMYISMDKYLTYAFLIG